MSNALFFARLKEKAMADGTPLTFGTVRRRRESAQQRLRREANRLDVADAHLRVRDMDRDDLNPTLTAAQLRLAADLLDTDGWGQID